MKTAFILAMSALMTVPAFAAFTEVECESSDRNVYLEIEQAWPTGSAFRHSTLHVTNADGSDSRYNYTVNSWPSHRMNYRSYVGGGLRLEIDTWPDQSPRWGRQYRATLRSTDLEGEVKVSCSFPFAN